MLEIVHRNLIEPNLYAGRVHIAAAMCWVASAAFYAQSQAYALTHPSAEPRAAAAAVAEAPAKKIHEGAREDRFWIGGAIAVSLIAPFIIL